MIPRFFRCGDPTKKCPNSVSREIFRDRPGTADPCGNENCRMHREDVGLVEGLTNGRSKLFYGAIAALTVVILLLMILGGGNPAEQALADLRARLVPLETELQALEAKARWRRRSAALRPAKAQHAFLMQPANGHYLDKNLNR